MIKVEFTLSKLYSLTGEMSLRSTVIALDMPEVFPWKVEKRNPKHYGQSRFCKFNNGEKNVISYSTHVLINHLFRSNASCEHGSGCIRVYSLFELNHKVPFNEATEWMRSSLSAGVELIELQRDECSNKGKGTCRDYERLIYQQRAHIANQLIECRKEMAESFTVVQI